MEWLPKLMEFIRLPLIYIAAFLLSSSCFIFFPDKLLIDLGVKSFRDNYRSYIGIVFIFSLSILVVSLLSSIMKSAKKKYRWYKSLRISKKALKELNKFEKNMLSEMINDDAYSIELDITDGYHMRLEQCKIIYRASNLSSMGTYFSYILQPWAIKYLKNHMYLLK